MKPKKTPQANSKPPAVLLKPCNAEEVQWDMQQIQLAITRRAFELFTLRNGEHGHDWEDWFQAESELLRPISILISETADRFSVRANVLGFTEKELKVSVEPQRITILGRMNAAPAETEGSATLNPDQALKIITLASEIDPQGTVVELDSGVLKLELPKVEKTDAKTAAAGKS